MLSHHDAPAAVARFASGHGFQPCRKARLLPLFPPRSILESRSTLVAESSVARRPSWRESPELIPVRKVYSAGF